MLAAERLQVSAVEAIQAQIVHLVQGEAGFGGGLGDGAVALHFRVVPAAAQQAVADARRPATAARDGLGTFRGQGHMKHFRAATGDDGEFRPGVELQPVHHAEAIVERLGNEPGPGRRAHQREGP